jgi:hypothetical protein
MAGASLLWAEAGGRVEVPLLLMTNKHSKLKAEELSAFRSTVWDEAQRMFASCGVDLKLEERVGELLKYPGGRPRFIGLEKQSLNVVLTDQIPLSWDQAKYKAGLATRYEGHHLCLIAVRAAHPNRVPFLDVNSVVHEMLHVFLLDIFSKKDGILHGQDREVRVDWHATRMWLLRGDEAVRKAAAEYVKRLGRAVGNV